MEIARLIREIENSDVFQVDRILDAAMKRKQQLYPDWEIFYCAAQKGKIRGVEDMLKAAWELEQRVRQNYGK